MINAKEAAQLTYDRGFDGAVLHALHLCNMAIQEATLLGQSYTFVPYFQGLKISKEVMRELKALGYEIKEKYVINVGPMILISWSYLLNSKYE